MTMLVSINHHNKMIDFIKTNKAIFIIVVFALLLRIAFFTAVQNWDEQEIESKRLLACDPGQYYNLALGIVQSGSFSNFGATRTPGYPVFLSIIFFLFGPKIWVVSLIQIFISICSLLLLYLLVKNIFGLKVALIAASLYAIDPHVIIISNEIMTETLFSLFFIATILLSYIAIKKKDIKLFLIVGFLLGITTLIRPVSQYFPFIIIMIILLYRGLKWPFKLKAIIAFVFIFIITIFPWLFRNQLEYNHFAFSSMGGRALFEAAMWAEVAKSGKPKDEIKNVFKQKTEALIPGGENNPFVISKVYGQVAKKYIFENVQFYSQQHFKRMVNIFINVGTKSICNRLGFEYSDMPSNVRARTSLSKMFLSFLKVKTTKEILIALSVGSFLMIGYILFFCGSIFLIYNREYFKIIFFMAIIAYFTIISGTTGIGRYRVPIIPFYVPISGYGLFEAYKLINKKISIRQKNKD